LLDFCITNKLGLQETEENAIFAHLRGNNNRTIIALIAFICKRWGQATTVPEGVESNHIEVEESGIPAWRVLLCALDHEAEVKSSVNPFAVQHIPVTEMVRNTGILEMGPLCQYMNSVPCSSRNKFAKTAVY